MRAKPKHNTTRSRQKYGDSYRGQREIHRKM